MKIATLAAVLVAASAAFGERKAHLATPRMKEFGPSVKPMRASSSFNALEDVLP